MVGPQIRKLLDDNPDAEAICCANDMMATAAYNVCESRGLKVGRDIAVTGYDDWEMAASMVPPLSTVVQNEYDVGVQSVGIALDLVKGKKFEPIASPAALKIRSSCGCKAASRYNYPKPAFGSKYRTAYVERISKILIDKSVVYNTNNEVKKEIIDFLRPIVNEVVEKVATGIDDLDKKTLLANISELLTGKYSPFISVSALLDALAVLIDSRITATKDIKTTKALLDVLITIQQQIQAIIIIKDSDRLSTFENNTMLMPFISRDMLTYVNDDKDFYASPMHILSKMNSKSTYMFMLDSPVRHAKQDRWELPKSLNLSSYHEGTSIVSYDEADGPKLTVADGMTAVFRKDERYSYCIYDIFMGDKQYGLLAAEIGLDDIMLFNQACMQISNALDFRNMYQKQRKLKRKLEKAISEVEAKNKVLSFISEYDQLTGCLNRRGFLEQTLTLMSEHSGEKAVMILSDLDHLKQINDTFGHSAGDFAIRSSSEIIHDALGGDAKISRMGGDEFSAVCLLEDKTGADVVDMIKKTVKEFNDDCDKPYYIEMSVGYCEFTCVPDMDLEKFVATADANIYEDKKNKRVSVIKSL
jgi:diguanylate cyclase (GGDEF)-like protein